MMQYSYIQLLFNMRGPALNLRSAILNRISQSPSGVWTALDFVDLGPRNAVDLALHRLIASKGIRRIARGLYDQPGINKLIDRAVMTHLSPPFAVETRQSGRPNLQIEFRALVETSR